MSQFMPIPLSEHVTFVYVGAAVIHMDFSVGQRRRSLACGIVGRIQLNVKVSQYL